MNEDQINEFLNQNPQIPEHYDPTVYVKAPPPKESIPGNILRKIKIIFSVGIVGLTILTLVGFALYFLPNKKAPGSKQTSPSRKSSGFSLTNVSPTASGGASMPGVKTVQAAEVAEVEAISLLDIEKDMHDLNNLMNEL